MNNDMNDTRPEDYWLQQPDFGPKYKEILDYFANPGWHGSAEEIAIECIVKTLLISPNVDASIWMDRTLPFLRPFIDYDPVTGEFQRKPK